MRIITVSGPTSAGKTSVILKAAACLRERGSAVGIVKFECLFTDDDQIYAAAGFPARKSLSQELCPNHFFISNIEDACAWGERQRLDCLITESVGLCNRCLPHIRQIMAVCVADQLSGIRTPAKIGPMLRLADEVVITKGDMAVAAEVIDSRAISEFCGVTSSNQVPNGDTIGRFRNLLIQNCLQEKLFADVVSRLKAKDLMLMKGTIVDSTLIVALSSTKNEKKERDPDAVRSRKAISEWYFGYKGHIAVDKDTGLVKKIETTAANVHDVTQVAALMDGTGGRGLWRQRLSRR